MNIPGTRTGSWGPPEEMIRDVANSEYRPRLDADLFSSEAEDEDGLDDGASDEEVHADESDGELYETMESMALEAEYRVEDIPDFAYAWGAEHSTQRSGVSLKKRSRQMDE